MDITECKVDKYMKNFCKSVPEHRNNWCKLLEHCKKSAVPLSNLAEMLRHVENASLEYLDDFARIQINLQFSILNCIEEELAALQKSLEALNKINHDFSCKLSNLEASTIYLDWSSESELVRGSATQPRLQKLLHMGYDYATYFKKALRNINNKHKRIDVRSETAMKEFETSFDVDLEEPLIRNLLAIIQYVDT